MAPHAFDERHQERPHYMQDHKYHAKGSRHAHADFDMHRGKLDRHLMPGYRERMGIVNETPNLLTHEVEDAEHEMHRGGHDVLVSEHEYMDDPVNFYEDPYHGEAVHYHEAHIEDTNPDDHDAHHCCCIIW